VSAAPEGKPLRLFVAVELPSPVIEALSAIQDGLRARRLAGLRWARPEGIHLTLKFLGDTPPRMITPITEALAPAARAVAPFELSLGQPGTFGGRRGPRVVWLDIGGDVEPLRQLQAAAESALVALDFPAEERAFSPHLTLARVRQPSPRELGSQLAEALAGVSPPDVRFEVRELALFSSTLRPDGAVYERLAALPLG
jgi:2'-5' RNA ligase